MWRSHGMWIFTFFGKRHCLLCFRAPGLYYSEAQEGSIGFIRVLLSWKKGWIEHLITGLNTSSLVQEIQVAEWLQGLSPSSPMGTHRDTQLNSKVQTLHPCIQGFRGISFPPVIWEGDSMHAALPSIKSWCTVSVLTAVTVPTGVTILLLQAWAETGLVVKEFLWTLLVLW